MVNASNTSPKAGSVVKTLSAIRCFSAYGRRLSPNTVNIREPLRKFCYGVLITPAAVIMINQASAAILTTEAAGTVNFGSVGFLQDDNTSSVDDFLSSSVDLSGAGKTASSSSSADLATGALKASASISGGGAPNSAIALARIDELLTFMGFTGFTTVEFIFEFDGTISGVGSFRGALSVDDNVSQSSGDSITLNSTGSDRITASLILSESNPIVDLSYVLDARALSSNTATIVNASQTGFLNILTEDGVTFVGSDENNSGSNAGTFLSNAPDLDDTPTVPIPATFWLLLSGFLGLVSWRVIGVTLVKRAMP